ncbi:MAG: hypothetical protein R3C14_46520 [Caldilineaceae bacterium]
MPRVMKPGWHDRDLRELFKARLPVAPIPQEFATRLTQSVLDEVKRSYDQDRTLSNTHTEDQIQASTKSTENKTKPSYLILLLFVFLLNLVMLTAFCTDCSLLLPPLAPLKPQLPVVVHFHLLQRGAPLAEEEGFPTVSVPISRGAVIDIPIVVPVEAEPAHKHKKEPPLDQAVGMSSTPSPTSATIVATSATEEASSTPTAPPTVIAKPTLTPSRAPSLQPAEPVIFEPTATTAPPTPVPPSESVTALPLFEISPFPQSLTPAPTDGASVTPTPNIIGHKLRSGVRRLAIAPPI